MLNHAGRAIAILIAATFLLVSAPKITYSDDSDTWKIVLGIAAVVGGAIIAYNYLSDDEERLAIRTRERIDQLNDFISLPRIKRNVIDEDIPKFQNIQMRLAVLKGTLEKPDVTSKQVKQCAKDVDDINDEITKVTDKYFD